MKVAAAIAVLILTAVLPTPVTAQSSPENAFDRHLFPPELVMQHQQKIGLRAEQRATITEAIQQLQAKVVDLQWKMQEESQKFGDILARSPVNETEALAQVDRVLAVERDVKRAHIAMLVRIRNTLSAEQQATLRSLR